ncbi:hypothetical protein CSQ89_08170 [Chitinimonas sp. BJB300]|nr:hypothetical protein CSQ89_08170 [Chitinimonas sp. BJB300]TSJ87283.1 hypothetical protein FG002_014990 [Chitinimonas sp. BJB300]
MLEKNIVSIIAAVLTPIVAFAAPAAYLEKSNIIGADNQVHIYRVPTKDVSGKVGYYDVAVTLSVTDSGMINTTSSTIVATASPTFFGNGFVPGNYKDAGGSYSCSASVAILNAGRMQTALSCYSGGGQMSATWVSGVIAGHPFELDLRNAGIDKIPGYENFSWGKIGTYNSSTWFGCMNNSEIVSAVQAGNSIQMSGYDFGNLQKCGVTLIKQ